MVTDAATNNSRTSGIHACFRLVYSGFTLNVDLALPGQGITAISGPSGSGKTTLLRCIAGLQKATGSLTINGACWQDSASHTWLPPHLRPLGYVFQDANLFPHLNVRRNLEYGWQRIPPDTRRIEWDHAIDLLGIGHLLERSPAHLSGGERQRVGIARALLTSPRLLLMDEPLSGLDTKRKYDILPYLERLQQELALPVLYVSHAADEIAQLADHLVLMNAGAIQASGPLATTLARLDLPTAFSDDAGVVITAQIGAHDDDYHLTRLDFSGGSVLVTRQSRPPGSTLRFRIYARDVSLAVTRLEGSTILNLLPVMITEIVPANTPAHLMVRMDANGTRLLARITRRSCDLLDIVPGRAMWAQIKSVALVG